MDMDDVHRAVLNERMADWQDGFVRGYETAESFYKASLKLGELDDIELLDEEIEQIVKARWVSVQGK